ncbi:MAG: hypothetical protein U0105_17725 [Candidatus Obscuribacterales bacterium]
MSRNRMRGVGKPNRKEKRLAMQAASAAVVTTDMVRKPMNSASPPAGANGSSLPRSSINAQPPSDSLSASPV